VKSPFVALQGLKFGDGWVEAGQPVPIETGRDYDAMLRNGMIAPAPAETASEPEADVIVIVVRPGELVLALTEEGEPHQGQYLGLVDEDGRQAARIALQDAEVTVPVEAVLPPASLAPYRALVERLAEQAESIKAAALRVEDLERVAALLGEERDVLLAKLAEKTATLPADALQRLVAVKGIGEKLAQEALAALGLTVEAPVPPGE
jgi:hypothetical protein